MEASIISLPSLIDDSAEDVGVDLGFDRDVAAGAALELGLQRRDLVVA